MVLGVGISEDDHQTISGGLVDIAPIGMDTIQKTGEVALDNEVHVLVWQEFTPPRIAADIHKEYRHILLFLLQRGGFRMRRNKTCDRLRHKLDQMLLDILQQAYFVVDSAF